MADVMGAWDVVKAAGNAAMIGAVADIYAMLAGKAGTRVATDVTGVAFAQSQA